MKTWHMNNTDTVFVSAKKNKLSSMIYVADMAVLKFNFDNDNDQIFSKFALR